MTVGGMGFIPERLLMMMMMILLLIIIIITALVTMCLVFFACRGRSYALQGSHTFYYYYYVLCTLYIFTCPENIPCI